MSKKNFKTEELEVSLQEILEMLKSTNGKVYSEGLTRALEAVAKIQQKQLEREKRQKAKQEEQAQKQREAEAKRVEQVLAMDLPLDWENAFADDERAKGVHVESVSDGLILSLTTLGRVDIEYIATVCDKDCKTVIETLRGAIFQNPEKWNEKFYCGWETADEYLSGNMLEKWRVAYRANQKYNGYFHRNLVAIKQLLHADATAENIYITLGSPWVPTTVIDEFLRHLLGQNRYQYEFVRKNPHALDVKHDEVTGSWEIPYKTYYGYTVTSTKTYGTSRMPAIYIIEKTLNMKTVQVLDEVSCTTNKSGKKRVVNKQETLAALEKQEKIIKEFQDWVWKDPARKKTLVNVYQEKFGYYHRRLYNGSFLTFPTMSPNVTLYPYQKNAVARVLFSPNTLLAHDVGSGKTYVMVAAGMELRRMGLSKKNLFVVPNNIVEQWNVIFREMYPQAKILCITPQKFVPSKRQSVLEDIRDNDYDGIIIPYSCFEQIPLSKKYYVDQINEEKRILDKILAKRDGGTSDTKKRQEKLAKSLDKLLEAQESLCSVCFDELGVTRLFVDEAHNFKNVPLDTNIDRVLGISSGGSQKCQDMLDKVRLVQKNNDGGGVVFATGTPITNSVTDVFVMQNYLQSGSLALLELKNFDSWIGMFAERATEFEVDVDTNSYRLATRFSRFHNLTELTALLAQVADFHQVDKNDGIPTFNGYTDALITRTQPFVEYLKLISQRADAVRNGNVNRKDDNMLKITTDGRKAALDLRLVDKLALFTPQSKVMRCAENVARIYFATASTNRTQLVFCDTSTPKVGFNLYDELHRILTTTFSVPPHQIAFVHDYESESRRMTLFEKVRKGEIRILMGSTFKLGLGVNVQDKLIALHHLDVPWRPADMTQREGRILRQGNTNDQVFIYRYITEGSFDAYSWQLLETKQRFISKLLAGSLSDRTSADVENVVLNYAEVKALAVGNPLIKKRVETANELEKYKTLQRALVETRIALQSELTELNVKIGEQKSKILKAKADGEFLAGNAFEYTKDDRKAVRETLHYSVIDNVFYPEERKILSWRGFDVILPQNMTKEAPFVWLQREGRYRVEMGDSEVGDLVRLDNFLDNFADYFVRLKKQLATMRERKKGIVEELAKEESYTDAIQEYQKQLEELDKQLGVKK